jgi:hypothetical protein
MLLYSFILTIAARYGRIIAELASMQDRLQKYQNRAARVITGATYDIRSSDLLENLNWKIP